jgi:predicted permease
MTNFLLIAISLISGLLLRKGMPKDAHKGINAWILYIALPAVSLKYIPHIQWSREMILPAISPIIVWTGGFLTILYFSRKKGMDKNSSGALTLTSSLSNTSFLGFPLVAAYFGEKAISTAIICDQVNFILFATVGLVVAVRASGKENLSIGMVINKIIKFPTFIGFMAALLIPPFIDISPLNPLLDILAGTVAPLALFSIGLQLQFNSWKSELNYLSVGLFYKLLLAPALVVLIALIFQLKGQVIEVSIFEAAMPSLVTSYVLIDEYNLNTKLANLMIGVGIVLAFITTSFWYFALQALNV